MERFAGTAGGAWPAYSAKAITEKPSMRADLKKGMLFAVALLAGLILIVAVLIFILATTGVLKGLSHL